VCRRFTGDAVIAHHPRVEIARGNSGKSCVIAGINKIRPRFERLDWHAAFRERGKQHASHRGFAAAAVDAGKDQSAGKTCPHQNSIPLRACTP
jgi:hypothetical protein